MDSLRVSISGRVYEIPTSSLQNSTIESLKSLMDAQNIINPRDLLKAFLESAEVSAVLKEAINEANNKLEILQYSKQD
ncbi:MAG: hypothetical protein SOW25_05120 [Helicobacter sp.]|nr:hypothetical protein [Helicobacteraceae bacterium]MDY3113694.1 hypothetical protein [Helicobacter sp.]